MKRFELMFFTEPLLCIPQIPQWVRIVSSWPERPDIIDFLCNNYGECNLIRNHHYEGPGYVVYKDPKYVGMIVVLDAMDKACAYMKFLGMDDTTLSKKVR